MKRSILNMIWVMGILSIAVFCISACDRGLDVKASYKYYLETLPVQKSISRGETAEIRCRLISEGDYKDNRYTIRYFQPDGKGVLKLEDGTALLPNDIYPLENKVFRLYYTSLSDERQTIDIYVEDSFSNIKQLSFSFNNKKYS